MNKTAAIAIGVGLVAGVGFVALRYYLLDKDEETEVAQFPDISPELKAQIQEAVMDPSTRIRRERPQRHEDTAADAT